MDRKNCFLRQKNKTKVFYAKSTLGSYKLSYNFKKVNAHVAFISTVISGITTKTV